MCNLIHCFLFLKVQKVKIGLGLFGCMFVPVYAMLFLSVAIRKSSKCLR